MRKARHEADRAGAMLYDLKREAAGLRSEAEALVARRRADIVARLQERIFRMRLIFLPLDAPVPYYLITDTFGKVQVTDRQRWWRSTRFFLAPGNKLCGVAIPEYIMGLGPTDDAAMGVALADALYALARSVRGELIPYSFEREAAASAVSRVLRAAGAEG